MYDELRGRAARGISQSMPPVRSVPSRSLDVSELRENCAIVFPVQNFQRKLSALIRALKNINKCFLWKIKMITAEMQISLSSEGLVFA